MNHSPEKAPAAQSRKNKDSPTASAILGDQQYVELAYDPDRHETSLIVWRDGEWTHETHVMAGNGRRLVPYSPDNNLIKNEVLLLPSMPEEYRTEAELVKDIQRYLHHYVDVSRRFEQIASYYVLLSWIYDDFNELPYLRLRGDYGSGKTRFLLIVGSICYKPFFASGASTVSPIFHILDRFRGTLIFDEADFRFSDEKAELVKILNNGSLKGMPVLRSEYDGNREFNPRAFQVFGPKIVATRGYYQDRALESRFITEEMGARNLRPDIPISLTDDYKIEARRLRNKLLLYRFHNLGKKKTDERLVDRDIEPRLNQIFLPLKSVISDPALQDELGRIAKEIHDETIEDRGMEVAADVLSIIQTLFNGQEANKITVKDVTEGLQEKYGADYERHISSKWVGGIIRRKLGLSTQRSNGVYIIPFTQKRKLERLYQKYGLDGGT